MNKVIKTSSALIAGIASVAVVGCGAADEGKTEARGSQVAPGGSQGQSYRQYITERREKLATVSNWLSTNPDQYASFKADPQSFAVDFGLRLTPEEIVAIQSAESLQDTVGLMRCAMYDAESQAVFDNNCGCGGSGGSCAW